MPGTHRERVEELLRAAADEHAAVLGSVPAELAASLPVDAQGVTRAIDHLATAAAERRRELDATRAAASDMKEITRSLADRIRRFFGLG